MTPDRIKEIEHWLSMNAYHASDEKERGIVSDLRQLLEERKWRSIDSAPVDGTPILVGYDYGSYGMTIMRFDGVVECFSYRKPTHWRKLPSPPEQGEGM